MLDQRLRDFGRVLRPVSQNVETAGWEPGFGKNGPDGPVATGGQLGRFQDGGVACCKGVDYGAEAEDVGCVPREMVSWEMGEGCRCGWERGLPGCYS